MTDPRNPARVTTYDYDLAGNRNYVLPPRGQGAANPERYADFFHYDNANQLDTSEAGRGLTDSRLTTYTYDDDGNETQRVAPGAISSVGGSLASRTTTHTYDGRGLLWATTTGTGSAKRTTVTEYDPAGNLRRLVHPAGVSLTTELPRKDDAGGTPTATSTWNEHATVYSYEHGQPAQRDVSALGAEGLAGPAALGDGCLTRRSRPYPRHRRAASDRRVGSEAHHLRALRQRLGAFNPGLRQRPAHAGLRL